MIQIEAKEGLDQVATRSEFDPWYDLAGAVIREAMKDYKQHLKSLLRKGIVNRHFELVDQTLSNDADWNYKRSLERFFRSDHFKMIAMNVNGEELIKYVKNDVLKNGK